MCARRVAASEMFWGLGFRRIPSGAAVVVEVPKTCQYYFFKFIKNVLCCGGEAECASKQILNCGLTSSIVGTSLLATSKMPGKRGRSAVDRSRRFVADSATATE